MKPVYKNLGKVCLTPAGDWNRQKTYERIDVVTHPITLKTYIAKKDVPQGINIENRDYWQPIGAAGYKNNNIIILYDTDENTGEIIKYNLTSAINSILDEDKVPGLILGFYGVNEASDDKHCEWFLYQFNSFTIDDWYNESCWRSIYHNINSFKGFFLNEDLLYASCSTPNIGDFAFVGENMESAKLYVCIEDNVWKNTMSYAFFFADKVKAIYSEDVEDYEVIEDETRADRATKDSLGRVIHDTYITREELSNFVTEIINKLKL